VHQTQDLLELIVFLLVAVVISQLLGQAKAGEVAAMQREREATQLYELSLALSGLQDVPGIALRLAQQILETFCAQQVSVRLKPGLGINTPVTALNDEAFDAEGFPTVAYTLATARGDLGEVTLWRDPGRLSFSEERLLRTYMSQGALALERAALAEAGNRARLLEESDRLKSTLLSSVPHELRTPLATIKASVTSLRSDAFELDEHSRKELLAAIDEEADHLNFMVGNLLDMSRIEMGALKPQKMPNSLSEILRGVLRRMRQQVEKHQIEIQLPEDLPYILVDYAQIGQVFTNLFSNSVKYAPAGTVISIKASIQPDHFLLVQVKNQGPPVSENDLDQIFEKFHRVTKADRITGTGLGLSICKGIVEAHGGRIWAENAADGFVFLFTLPLLDNPPGDAPDLTGETGL
jgi:two-component system sensor histidine kinase KdpD